MSSGSWPTKLRRLYPVTIIGAEIWKTLPPMPEVIEVGHVCKQRPFPGKEQSVRLPVTVQLQTEDPRRGGKGDYAWRLVPDLTGMTIDQARASMRDAGFSKAEKTVLFRIDEPGCTAGVICRSSPSALQRSYLNAWLYVYTGRDPNAPPPPPARPADALPPPAPTTTPGQPTAPPPPADAVPEPFF